MPILHVTKLADPETKAFAGLRIEGDAPPNPTSVSGAFLSRGLAEGWLSVENDRMEYRPAGPAHAPHSSVHAFSHADAVVLHTIAGDVRYRVTRQPDKYVVDDDQAPVTPEHYEAGNTRVDWHYELELVA